MYISTQCSRIACGGSVLNLCFACPGVRVASSALHRLRLRSRTQQLDNKLLTTEKNMKQLQEAVTHPQPGYGEDVDDEARRLLMGRWRSALGSGLRAALACTIVGIFSLYAPPVMRRHITFPAFSYVVTVIIVTDATLGTALRGAVSAVHATLMGALPSVLALWLAHHTGTAESVVATSAVVALTTFAVALPESVGPVAKRIALGQIIIIYVARFQQGERASLSFALLHPANVVACTVLAVVAALMAVLLPWPTMASSETTKKSRAYKVLAAERVRVMADAFLCYSSFDFKEEAPPAICSCQRRRRWSCLSQAKRLASAGTTLLHRINSIREDVRWERALSKGSSLGLCMWTQAADDLNMEEMETPLKGMQMALEMIQDASPHGNAVDDLVMRIKDQVRLALLTPTKSSKQSINLGKKAQALLAMLSRGYDEQLLAPLLFLFSLHQLHSPSFISNSKSNANKQVAPAQQQQDKDQPSPNKSKSSNCSHNMLNRHQLMAACKCGFSLGLAVLLGLLFSNDHGFWSGLVVATTMAASRESTWAVGIARAHGTTLGSVYGVLGCLLLSQRQLLTMDLRFVALLPWMVLSTFLKRSRAYGPAGGVAAALSAIIIMGRRYNEPPMAFTIARLVETFIGISCAILADLLFQPGRRPSVQARMQLTRCITTLTHCIVAPLPDQHDSPSQLVLLRKVQQQLALLRKYIAEAKREPTYLWLPPFPTCTYDKIEGSLSRMVQLLHFYLQASIALPQPLDLDAMADVSSDDFNRVVSTSLNRCILLATNNNSPSSVQDETSQHSHDDDLEAGRGPKCSTRCSNEEEIMTPQEVVGSFLEHARQTLLLKEDEEEVVEGLEVCCVATMGLCMGEIIKEALWLEAHILDLSYY